MKWQDIAARWSSIRENFRIMVSENTTETGCRLWLGHVATNGYGVFSLFDGKKSQGIPAHRVAYAIGVDDFTWVVPQDDKRKSMSRVVRHAVECPNKHCVEFSHLLAGTQAENIEDNRSNGKLRVGELNGIAKLTDDQVREIRAEFEAWTQFKGGKKSGYGPYLAKKYNVTRELIHQVVHGVGWKHVK